MRNRIFAAFVSLLMAVAGSVGIASPAQAAPGCTTFGFCLHDTPTVNPAAFYSGSVPRNTCIALSVEDRGITSYVTERTGVQWWLFRTTICDGSHYVVHAGSDANLTFDSGWNNATNAIMRTALTD